MAAGTGKGGSGSIIHMMTDGAASPVAPADGKKPEREEVH
jgi:hypothetical protein